MYPSIPRSNNCRAGLAVVAVVDSPGWPPTTEAVSNCPRPFFTKPLRLYVTPRLGVNVGSACPYWIVKLLAVTERGAGRLLNDWVKAAALYDGLAPGADAGADAVILQRPTPVTAPEAALVVAPTVHGPDAVKVTGIVEVALTENVLPYCTFGNVAEVDCFAIACWSPQAES